MSNPLLALTLREVMVADDRDLDDQTPYFPLTLHFLVEDLARHVPNDWALPGDAQHLRDLAWSWERGWRAR